MYRQQISRKTSPSFRSTPISKKIAPSRSYGSLSSVVQRLQQDPNSVSGDERQQLESAIGTRALREILAGKQTSWVPEFKGISAQLWGDSGQEVAPIQAKEKHDINVSAVQPENKTGLPDNLKAGIENISGMAMDDVRVHYNSDKPAELQALAYTQGTDIHVAPGQEQHLPHEAWHVVQQMQGRVKPTVQMKGVEINDDQGLEREADVMGAKAISLKPDVQEATRFSNGAENGQSSQKNGVEHSSQLYNLSHNLIQLRCEKCLEEEEDTVQRNISSESLIQRFHCQGTQHDTSNEHRVIEIDYMTQINPYAEREFEIPEGSLDQYGNGTHKTGYADIADRAAKELYEIKRHNEAYPQAQLDRYLNRANHSCTQGWTAGNYYPSERIIDFSVYEQNTEIIARKDVRLGFIRYEKRQKGGPLGIAAAMGGGVYVSGMANQVNLPPLNQWVDIWTQAIWDKAEKPESINPDSQAYQGIVQQVQQVVQGVQNSLRGGTLDKDLLMNGWRRLENIMTILPF